MIRFFLVMLSSILFAQGAIAATYYVRTSSSVNPGNDADDGLTWNNAWATIANVNSRTAGGDTVFFGTGIWRETLDIKAGTYSDRTVYACSSFAETNAAGEPYFAQIWGSNKRTGWTLHSGNIYKSYITFPEDSMLQNSREPNLWDASAAPESQWMQRRTSLAGIIGAGEWYWNGTDSLYAWVGGNDDPDNHDMELTVYKGVVRTWNDNWIGQDHVTLYGFRLKYGGPNLVMGNYIMMETEPYDSVFIDHCHLSHVSDWSGRNPALVYSGWSASWSKGGRFNRVRACSLGYAYAISDVTYSPSSNKGSGIDHYNQADFLIDSCNFYGYFKQGAIYWKAARTPAPWSENIIIRYNTFTNTNGYGVEFFGNVRNNEVYGNIFDGVLRGIKTRRSRVAGGGSCKYYNNTFVNCPEPLLMSSGSGDGSNYQIDNEFKYNVIYSTTDQKVALNSFGGPGNEFIDVDSNLYYNNGGSLNLQYPTGTSVSLSYWQNTVGMDKPFESKFTESPGFTDSTYARNGASGEMDITYGGQRWTKFGAVQDSSCQGPSAPNPLSPTCGSTDVSQPVTVTWSSVPGADSYQVQWDASQQFGSGAQLSPEIFSPTTSYTLPDLLDGVQYFWRVRSSDSCGWGSWSSPCDFSTACLPLGTVALSNPSDGATGLSQPFPLVWGTVSGANWYRVQVDNDLSFASPVVDAQLADTIYPVSALTDSASYYWRVRAGNVCDSSSWSVPWSFSVIPDSSAPIILKGSWSTGLSHTAGSGSSRLLVLVVNWEGISSGGDKPISSASYGGQSMTQAVRVVGGLYNGTEIWYIDEFGINAATGSSFSINWSNGAPAYVYYAAATYDNVNQTLPLLDFSSNSTSDGSISPLTTTVNVVANGMSVAGASHGNDGTYTWANGWVNQTEQNGLGVTGSTADHPETSTGTSTASVTHSTSNKRNTIAAISLAPAMASGDQDITPPARIIDLGAIPGSAEGSASVFWAVMSYDGIRGDIAAIVIRDYDIIVGRRSIPESHLSRRSSR